MYYNFTVCRQVLIIGEVSIIYNYKMSNEKKMIDKS